MFLTEFFQAVGEELHHLVEEYLESDGPSDQLRRKLRVMYGRGEISRSKFYQLRNMLDQGYYIEGELMSLHRQAMNRRGMEGQASERPLSKDVARSLEYVYLNRARLDEVRSEMRRAHHILEDQREWMQQQAQDFHQRAQQALPDEDAARRYLDIRQQMLEQLDILDQRVRRLQQEMQRVDVLEARLRLSESELMIVDSRERLARVEVSSQRQLHS